MNPQHLQALTGETVCYLHVHQVTVSVGVFLFDLRRYNSWMRDASCVGTWRTRNHVMGKPKRREEKKQYVPVAIAAKAGWNFATIH